MMNGRYVSPDNGSMHWHKEVYPYGKRDGKHVINGYRIEWYKDNKLHREDGPAVECADGSYKEWQLNGQLHREDGPAIEWSSGGKAWWIHGIQYAEEEFNDYLTKKNLKNSLHSDLEQKEQKPKVKI